MITEPHYSPASRLRVVAQRLLTAGIIAHVRGSFSTQALTEIGDALLAAPIAAVLLAILQPDALNAIRILRHRGREHMLVGASEIESVADVERAVAAGAQFLLSPYHRRAAAKRADALDVLYIPGVLSATEAALAFSDGRRHLCYAPADVLGLDHLAALQIVAPEPYGYWWKNCGAIGSIY